MATQVIVLNGGSSSGKSGIGRCLQAVLPEPWLLVGVDTFIELLPGSLRGASGGVEFGADGRVVVGAEFRALEEAWAVGIAAMVRAGARVIIDEVLLGGGDGQRRWGAVLAGLEVLWVGVRCSAEVAAGREMARGDRIAGMAAAQAELVHRGVGYDLEVDTVGVESVACARVIAARVRR
ncbi:MULTISPECIES: chloramphenicol phosphotransferase CPT [unclassified Crossiella]|uniref:chloramphenicol phosphotransferase CPT n=1 Tax=unclassified Crossiella TaxID=2620835 RepID=UPI002000252D|nr:MULTISPECIES: chloramphenicol phosphotransferase CPT [unclassified Crossiella]MCK2240886.1 chloramphenicol phosphotransferase CPT [Crossiella sp. S99.2]MCK2253970.1 chloramphenicol phosphotransferase CPT [Crossiella sp. S99.1]